MCDVPLSFILYQQFCPVGTQRYPVRVIARFNVHCSCGSHHASRVPPYRWRGKGWLQIWGSVSWTSPLKRAPVVFHNHVIQADIRITKNVFVTSSDVLCRDKTYVRDYLQIFSNSRVMYFLFLVPPPPPPNSNTTTPPFRKAYLVSASWLRKNNFFTCLDKSVNILFFFYCYANYYF